MVFLGLVGAVRSSLQAHTHVNMGSRFNSTSGVIQTFQTSPCAGVRGGFSAGFMWELPNRMRVEAGAGPLCSSCLAAVTPCL